VHSEQGRQVDGVKLGVDILAVHDYLGEILPLLPADTYQKLIDFGNRHYFEGRYDVALNCFSHAVKMDPTSLAYSERAWSYYQLNRHDEALADLELALELDDENVPALRVRSLIHKQQDRTAEALADVNRAIALDPNNALAYYDRGTLYYSLEDYKAAVSDFTEAIAIDSENVSYLQYRADALQEMGSHDRAIADLQTAIELEPGNSYTVWLFGYSMFYTGDFNSAQKAFLTAYELDPTDADCLTWAGDSARNLDELDTAVGLYNKAIELDEDQAWAFFGRGLCYKAAGNRRQSEADFAHAEQLQRGITDYAPRGSSVSNESSSSLLPENPNQRVSQRQASPLVGVWVCDFTYNQAPARMAILCDAEGNYEFAMVVDWPNGQRKEVEEKGTYRFDGRTVTTTDQDGQTSKLRCTINGDRMTLYVEDFNGTFNFRRYEG
jgi:tetratricopeptide (TPR) repeat protein